MKFAYRLIILFGLLLAGSLHAQVDLGQGFRKDKKGQESFARAEEFYDRGDYLQALPYYRSLESQYGGSDYLIFRIGICLLYKSDETEAALDYLGRVKAKNPKAADIDLYLARAYHLNGQYDQAIQYIDLFLQKKNNMPEQVAVANRLKQNCLNAKEFTAHPGAFSIVNIGPEVNTENSEYVPVLSSDDSVLLFTYRGSRSVGGLQSFPGIPDSSGIYFEDVFYSFRLNGKWQQPVPLDSTINGNGHDACIGLSNDGQTLLIYKDQSGNGDIYTSQLTGFYWTSPAPLRGYVNSEAWDGSATFASDMRTLYFASERPGGYGGRDIWMATLQYDGTWGNVRNLGPTVNTPYNEDAPFMHPNNSTLIFSSEGHNSMGGYDLFKTNLDPVDSTFSKASPPENLGYPINTPGDDKYFVLGTDGLHGYYSSGKAGGMGQQDIYVVNGDFNIGTANVMQLSGIIRLDDTAAYASVNIRDSEGKLQVFHINSNPESGKYLVNVPLGHQYTITYELPGGADRQIKELDTRGFSGMQKKEMNIDFFSGAYALKDSLRKPVVRDTAMFKLIPPDSLTLRLLNPYDPGLVMKVYGNATKPGLIFRVQIAAYTFPENYNSGRLSSLGTIEKVMLDDGIMRFTMGKFNTLAEAEAYCQQIIAAGQTDAFVTAELNGKRYLIRELVSMQFFQDISFFENHPLNRK